MKTHPGISLLEVLMAIALLAVLFTLVLTGIGPIDVINQNNDGVRRGDAIELFTAMEQYAIRTGSYPNDVTNASNSSVTEICQQGNTGSCIELDILIANNYLSDIPVDPDNAGTETGYYLIKDTNGRVGIGGQVLQPDADTPTFVEGIDEQGFTIP